MEILEGPFSRGGYRESFILETHHKGLFREWSPTQSVDTQESEQGVGEWLLPPQICSLCFIWASFTFSASVEGGGCSRWQPIISWYTKTPQMEPRSGETMGTHHQCRPVLEGKHW